MNPLRDNYLKEELYELVKKDEAIFDFIQESSLDGLWYWDLERPENEWMNPRFWTTLGYDPALMPHKSSAWQDIIDQEDLQVALENFTKHCEDPNHPYDQIVKYRHKNGSTIWIRCRGLAIRDTDGKPIRMLGAHQDITDIKIAKDRAQENERKLRDLLAIATDGVCFLDENGVMVEVNDGLAAIMGYTKEELTGMNIKDTIHPDDFEKSQHYLSKLRTEGVYKGYQGRIIRKSGEIRYIEVNAAAAFKNGRFAGSRDIIHDITERKKAEQQLIVAKEKAEENERKYGLIANNTDDSIWAMDANLKFTFLSPSTEKLFGYTIEEWETPNWDKFVHPDDLQAVLEVFGSLREGKRKKVDALSVRVFHKKGKAIWAEFNANGLYNEHNQFTGAVGVTRDVTERKRIEIELFNAKELAQKNESLLNVAGEIAKVGGWQIDMKQNTLTWSKQVYTIHEVDADFVPTLEKAINFYDQKSLPIIQEAVDNAISTGQPYDVELGIITAKGNHKHVRAQGKIRKNRNGKVDFVYGVFQDITKQVNAQREAISAKEKAEESDRLKTAFLQNLSHEIRTPLNAISGFSGMLGKSRLTEEKVNSFVSIIQTSSKQLISIVSDILTISSLETNQEKVKITAVSINSIIVDTLAIFKQQSSNQNISLYAKQTLNDKEAEVFSDKTKLIQILNNLISNALKFTHQGYVEFGCAMKGAEIEFFVKDTGIGIQPHLQEKIFERFRQADLSTNRKYGGTGLGLAISKGLVELLGGRIWVESVPKEGATFYFTIPYKPVNSDVESSKIGISHKKVIVVAEDEEFNFLYIQQLLIDLDYHLIHARNGKEAVDIVEKNDTIDLILMDIKMPIMDGHTAAKIIKERNSELPIIAQSAFALEHEIEMYGGIFDDYLTKPIEDEELIDMVEEYLSVVQ